jgi:hypoxanthine phosphoribosyltransferase
MEEVRKHLLFDSNTIADRVRDIGKQITADFPEGDVLLIGILKGAYVFVADLARAISYPCQVDFARISSYGSSTVTSGTLSVKMDIGIDVEGRDVILVDDIVDSGLTLAEYRNRISVRNPRSLRLAAMIDKTGRREKAVQLDYFGFRIEEGFVVGYGLDWDEKYRNLDSIYTLEFKS